MLKWVTWVRDPKTGATWPVTVEADNVGQAQALVEMKYGAENVLHHVSQA
jgi:hypothetical protein